MACTRTSVFLFAFCEFSLSVSIEPFYSIPSPLLPFKCSDTMVHMEVKFSSRWTHFPIAIMHYNLSLGFYVDSAFVYCWHYKLATWPWADQFTILDVYVFVYKVLCSTLQCTGCAHYRLPWCNCPLKRGKSSSPQRLSCLRCFSPHFCEQPSPSFSFILLACWSSSYTLQLSEHFPFSVLWSAPASMSKGNVNIIFPQT